MKQLSQATTWNNSCGLASISTLLMDKLGSAEWQKFTRKPIFKQLLKLFSLTYQTPNLNWEMIAGTVKSYLHPEDQQIIWIPPLRALLKEVLLKEKDYRDTFFQTFLAALDVYILEGEEPEDNAYLSLFQSNRELFEFLRHEALKIPAQFRFQKIQELIHSERFLTYWQETAYPAYCDYVSQIDNGVMLTAEELSLLCKSLQINLSILSSRDDTHPDETSVDGGAKGYQGAMSLGKLDVRYKGNHWEPYLEVNTQARNKALWQHGKARLNQNNLAELSQSIKAQFTDEATSSQPVSQFEVLTANNQYNDLAQCLLSEPHLLNRSGVRKCIDDLIERQDIPLLLSIFCLHSEGRNYIVERLFISQNNFILSKLSNYASQLKLDEKNISSWANTLNRALQSIDKSAGDSPLHQAIRQNKSQEAINLIRQNADLAAKNEQGESPLHLIIGLERLDILKALISYKKEVYNQLAWYQSPYLLDLTAQNKRGDTPLHYAAMASSAEYLATFFADQQLLSNIKRDIDNTNNLKQTPLHLAAANLHEENVKLLIRLGSKVYVKDKNGHTSLDYAACYNRAEHVRLIKSAPAGQRRAQIGIEEAAISNAFAIALANEAFAIQQALLSNDRDSLILLRKHKNKEGLTAVHLAAARGNVAFLEQIFKWFWNHNLTQTYDANGRTLVHTAAEFGQLEVIKLLREKGISFSSKDNEGYQPLHLAAANGHDEVVQFLLAEYQKDWKAVYENPTDGSWKRYGRITVEQSLGLGIFIDLNPKNNAKQTPYRLAARNKHWAVAKHLREYIGDDKYYLAIQKIQENDAAGFADIVKKEPSIVHEVDENDFYLLHHIMLEAGDNTLTMCESLKEAGASFKVTDKTGKTAIHQLATNWDWERQRDLGILILKFLRKNGVNVNATENRGFTALHLAASYGKAKAISILMHNDMNVDQVSSDGLTALHMAAWSGKLAAFKVLLDYHADLNLTAYPSSLSLLFKGEARSDIGITPLWLALQQEHEDILKEIITRKLAARDYNSLSQVKNNQGQGLLHFFAAKNDKPTLEQLTGRIALTDQDQNGWSPLHVAATLGHKQIASCIVEPAVNKKEVLEQTTKDGKTPFLIAKEAQQQEVMQYLLSQGAKELSEPVAKGLLQKGQEALNKQQKLAAELEQTTTYQILNNCWHLGAPLLSHFYAGPAAMGLNLVHNYFTYATPSLMLKLGGQLYYSIKPYAHNYAPWWVESSIDNVATLSSKSFQLTFEGMRKLDWIQHPLRRGSGYVASHLLLYMATWFTDNKNLLASAYFFGREAGMALVDAYQYRPIEGRQELSQAYTVWGAILGKERGEAFADSVHQIVTLRNNFYTAIAPASNNLFDGVVNFSDSISSQVNSYKDFLLTLNEAPELLSPSQLILCSVAELCHRAMKLKKEISVKRDVLLKDLEKVVVENLAPEGEYQRYAIKFIEGIKLTLFGSKLQEFAAEKDLAQEAKDQAEKRYEEAKTQEQVALDNPAATESERKLAHQKKVDAEFTLLQANSRFNESQLAYEAAEKQFNEQANLYKEAYDRTPSGMKQLDLIDAQKQEVDARMAVEVKKLQMIDHLNVKTEQERQSEQQTLQALENTLQEKTQKRLEFETEYLKVINSIEKEVFEKAEVERQQAVENEIKSFVSESENKIEKLAAYQKIDKELSKAQEEVDAAKTQADKDKAAIKVKDQRTKKKSEESDKKLKQAQEKRDQLEAQKKAAKEVYVNLLTPEQQELFYKQIDLDKINADASQAKINAKITQDAYEKAQKELDALETKIYQIDHPKAFNATTLVDYAIQQSDDDDVRVRLIIRGVVATGVIEEGDALERMYSTLIAALETHGRSKKRENLIKALDNSWDAIIHGDYRQNFVYGRNKKKKDVEAKKAKHVNAVKEAEELEGKAKAVEEEIANLLPESERNTFVTSCNDYHKSRDLALWNASHPTEERKELIILVGQPKFALDLMGHDAYAMISPHQHAYYCEKSAEILINYKYLMLPEPSVEQKQAEIKRLSNDLKKQPIKSDSFLEAKHQINKEIAAGLIQSSLQSSPQQAGDPQYAKVAANDIDVQLRRALTTNDSNTLQSLAFGDGQLVDKLAILIGADDLPGAQAAIVDALEDNTSAISKNYVKSWAPPPPAPFYPDPAPNVAPPKERHGAKKWWDEGIRPAVGVVAQEIIDKLKGPPSDSGGRGTTFGIGTNGFNVALPGQEPVTIYSFNKEPAKPLFEIPQKQGSSMPIHTPAKKEVSSPPSPIYSPMMTKPALKPALPTPTLAFNSKHPGSSVSGQTGMLSSPLIQTTAYIPSLSPTAGQPLIFKHPNLDLPTPAIVFADVAGAKDKQREVQKHEKKTPNGLPTPTKAGVLPHSGIPLKAAPITASQKPIPVNWLMSWMPEGVEVKPSLLKAPTMPSFSPKLTSPAEVLSSKPSSPALGKHPLLTALVEGILYKAVPTVTAKEVRASAPTSSVPACSLYGTGPRPTVCENEDGRLSILVTSQESDKAVVSKKGKQSQKQASEKAKSSAPVLPIETFMPSLKAESLTPILKIPGSQTTTITPPKKVAWADQQPSTVKAPHPQPGTKKPTTKVPSRTGKPLEKDLSSKSAPSPLSYGKIAKPTLAEHEQFKPPLLLSSPKGKELTWKKVPGLTLEAGKELVKETVEAAEWFINFTQEEVKRGLRKEKLQSWEALTQLGTFISNDFDRIVTGEETETARILRDTYQAIKDLDGETKYKEAVKLAIALVNPPKLAAKAGKQAVKAAKAGAKAAAPVVKTGVDAVKKVGGELANYEFRSPFIFSYRAGKLNANIPFDEIGIQKPITKKKSNNSVKSNEVISSNPGITESENVAISEHLAKNHINGLRLELQLADEEIFALFKTNGELTRAAIEKSFRLPMDIKNDELKQILLQKGGRLSDWGKYETEPFHTKYGLARMHFYHNPITHNVYYGMDYKVVFDHQGFWRQEAARKLPKPSK